MNMTNEELAAWLARHGGEVAREPSSSGDKYSSNVKITAKDGASITISTTPEQDGSGNWSFPVAGVDERAKAPPASATRKPPEEKDEGGRRYVWDEDTGGWRDVGSAPPNPQERIAAEQARRVVNVSYTGTGQNRQKVTTYSDNSTTTEAAPQEKKAVSVTYDADGTKVTTYDDASQAREAPSPADRRAESAANRPVPVAANPTQRTRTQFNPATGTYEAVDNPGFDEDAYNRQQAKEKAAAERDRLSLMIEAGKLTEASAANQYKRWFDENVTLPMKRAEEARARAAEIRAAQQAEDARKQYAASYEKDRQTTALNIGQTAAGHFNNNLQYQVGPKFGEQFAQALNSFQPGAPPAEFTADAFTFKGPSIEAVARKATAKALAGISPYAKAISTAGDRPLQVAQYDPSMDPAAIAPSAAPPPYTPPDYAGMVNQFLESNPYTPGVGSEEEQ